jgi:hypothetical protein
LTALGIRQAVWKACGVHTGSFWFVRPFSLRQQKMRRKISLSANDYLIMPRLAIELPIELQ